MGACVSCPGLSGDDLVRCYFGVTNMNDAKAAHHAFYSAAGLSEFADDFWQMQLDFNQGKRFPISSWMAITPDNYQLGYDYWCNEQMSRFPPTWGDPIRNAQDSGQWMNVNLFTLNIQACATFKRRRDNLQALCGPMDWKDVFPYFYMPYNTVLGRNQIDNALKDPTQLGKLPSAAVAVLKFNYTNKVLQDYGVLSAPDYLSYIPNEFYFNDDPNNPAFVKGLHLATMQNDGVIEPAFTKLTWKHNKVWGDPRWGVDDLQAVYRKIIGENYDTGKSFLEQWAESYVDHGYINPGQTPVQYLDPAQHPGIISTFPAPYDGNLPFLPAWTQVDGTYHLATTDKNAYGYKNSCTSSSDSSILGVIGAIVGGGLAAAFIPGSKAKVYAAATAGSTLFYIFRDSVGWQALSLWSEGVTPHGGEEAANILTVGGPITLVQMFADVGMFPKFLGTASQQQQAMIGGVVVSFVLLRPILIPALEIGAGGFMVFEAPVALTQYLVGWFMGCANHVNITGFECDCESASTKPGLAEALVGPIFGMTGSQYAMRKAALMARMTTGMWGTDTFGFGECDANGHMSNLIGCISAGEWATQKWPKEFDPEATEYWNEIKDVFDPANLSFLPPRDVDAPCKQYGEHFRIQGDGTCKDTRAPIGKQGPGQYVWPTETAPTSTKSECVIL